MSLYFITSCLGVSLVLMFGFHGRAVTYVGSVSADAFTLGDSRSVWFGSKRI
jgi:hypothetical protein